MSSGRLMMASGTLEDVPTIVPEPTFRVLAALPLWPPQGVVIGTEALFHDEYAGSTRFYPVRIALDRE